MQELGTLETTVSSPPFQSYSGTDTTSEAVSSPSDDKPPRPEKWGRVREAFTRTLDWTIENTKNHRARGVEWKSPRSVGAQVLYGAGLFVASYGLGNTDPELQKKWADYYGRGPAIWSRLNTFGWTTGTFALEAIAIVNALQAAEGHQFAEVALGIASVPFIAKMATNVASFAYRAPRAIRGVPTWNFGGVVGPTSFALSKIYKHGPALLESARERIEPVREQTRNVVEENALRAQEFYEAFQRKKDEFATELANANHPNGQVDMFPKYQRWM